MARPCAGDQFALNSPGQGPSEHSLPWQGGPPLQRLPQLRPSALMFFHSHSGATGVFCLICRTVYFLCAANLIAASGKTCIRRLKVGDLLIKNSITLCITMSSIPCSRSVVISVPLSRQRRHLTQLPEGVKSTIPMNALRKNASGVAMRMKIRQSKTPQFH